MDAQRAVPLIFERRSNVSGSQKQLGKGMADFLRWRLDSPVGIESLWRIFLHS